jgi:hypothetical protein
MEKARKITVEIPPELLDKAQRASGTGITQTVRTGLQLVAASQAYAKLRGLRGKTWGSFRQAGAARIMRKAETTSIRARAGWHTPGKPRCPRGEDQSSFPGFQIPTSQQP